jgi:hypothetical protein
LLSGVLYNSQLTGGRRKLDDVYDAAISKLTDSRGRGLLMTLAALACAGALAACGSSGPSSAAASGGANPAANAGFLKFSQCMRSHGLSSFPDPSAHGGINLDGTGLNPQSPQFKSAQAACTKLLPGGGPGAAHPTARDRALTLRISQCMREHGVSGFPDPTLTPPSSPNGYSQVIDRGGVVLAIPNTINTASPAFTQAATACGFGH